jgi:hypothetical protein
VRRLTIWTLIAAAAVSVFLFVLAPSRPRAVSTVGWEDLSARTVAGAYHVHTTRSDGHGDKAEVAAAAARAGLKFVILTDHGDGTRPPDPPEYVNGVLVLDAVEISTDEGHYVALDMPRAPYPLGGAGEAVVEDVRRLGGFGIAAHPDSPKPGLRWTDTTSPIDGIEWLNADSEWRDEGRGRLMRAGVTYFFRSAGSLATLLDRPSTLERWDRLLRARRVVALAASDAHGGAGRRDEDQSRTFFSTIGIPGYEASFRELSIRAVLERPLSGNAGEDARAVYGAIRKGSVFSVIDALASPALLDFHAVPSGATVTLQAAATVPASGDFTVLRDGQRVVVASGAPSHSAPLRHEVPAASGTYRVEVQLPGAPGEPPVPWLVSNPIYIGPVADATAAAIPPAGGSHRAGSQGAGSQVAGIAPFPWRIEKDAASSAILRTSDTAVELQYRLAEGARNNQFVALATDVGGQAFSAIDLRLVSDRPARVAVQVRSTDGRRWGSSFYVDPGGQLIHAAIDRMRPVGNVGSLPPRKDMTSILIVVDLTNAAPGRAGTLTVASSALIQ